MFFYYYTAPTGNTYSAKSVNDPRAKSANGQGFRIHRVEKLSPELSHLTLNALRDLFPNTEEPNDG